MEDTRIRKNLRAVRGNTYGNMSYKFDLSHIPLKEDSHECPLWVGDVREKYYKRKTKGGRYEKKKEESEQVTQRRVLRL